MGRWEPRQYSLTGIVENALRKAGVTVEPMNPENCSTEYWLEEYTNPTSTPFFDWHKNEAALGRSAPWQPNYGMTFGVMRCWPTEPNQFLPWETIADCYDWQWLGQ